jgi:beta-glucanase (GH16 family)
MLFLWSLMVCTRQSVFCIFEFQLLNFIVKKYLIQISFIVVVLFITACSKSAAPPVTPFTTTPPALPVDKGWSFETTPTFADEFNYTGTPDTSKWGYDLGGGGWGNQELEYYTDSLKNAHVSNGVLHITAAKQFLGGMNYTSARMVSKNNGYLLYGRIVASAKLPPGKGTWPAIWMLSNNWVYGSWPASGEIDIMEQVGFDPLNVHFSVHNSVNYGSNSRTETTNIPTDTSSFHKYRVDWTPYAIRGYYDDTQVFSFVNPGDGPSEWPFDQKFHVLINLAIGGTWGGAQGVDPNIFPATMQVDYIRFYKMIPK